MGWHPSVIPRAPKSFVVRTDLCTPIENADAWVHKRELWPEGHFRGSPSFPEWGASACTRQQKSSHRWCTGLVFMACAVNKLWGSITVDLGRNLFWYASISITITLYLIFVHFFLVLICFTKNFICSHKDNQKGFIHCLKRFKVVQNVFPQGAKARAQSY